MTTHIIWAVIWFVLMLVFFYGGGFIAWATGAAALVLPNKPTAAHAGAGLIGGITVFLIGLALAVFALIKCILQIVAAFHS